MFEIELPLRTSILFLKFVHPILYILYYCFKAIVWVSLRFFYSKITVINRERGKFKNPCIVVSNHPSTVLDPLNAAIEIDTEVFFLANASLFKTRFTNWFFNTFYCIPVERYEDTGGKPLNNAASFEKSTRHLAGGGCLYVAPEGTSYIDRRLRKVKTGTARIALAAESRHNFQLGLTILPIGLNYSDPTQFRSHLLTILDEPIRVADFQKDWERDEVEAVQNLTARIAEKLSALILDTTDEEEDQLLRHLETMLQNENPLPPFGHLRRSQAVLDWLKVRREQQPVALAAFRQQVFDYFEKMKPLKISDEALAGNGSVNIFLLLLTFPAFLLGYLTHFLPVFSAKKLSDGLNDDIHWEPTYKYVAGLVTYPVFLGLQIWLVSLLAAWLGWAPWLTLGYVLSIMPVGWVAEWWLEKWKRYRKERRYLSLTQKNKLQMEELRKNRVAILKFLSQNLS